MEKLNKILKDVAKIVVVGVPLMFGAGCSNIKDHTIIVIKNKDGSQIRYIDNTKEHAGIDKLEFYDEKGKFTGSLSYRNFGWEGSVRFWGVNKCNAVIDSLNNQLTERRL